MKLHLRRVIAVSAIAAAVLVSAIGSQASAQSIGAGAGCTITSEPIVSTGAAVKLLYEVDNRPTFIEISASDSSANPASTPTVGAPDPTRADATAVGTIMTGPIKKETTFTMSVSNSRGASKCRTTVYFKAKPAAGWPVPLVSQQPVYSRLQIPGGFDTTFGDWPFHTAYWISSGQSGFFVVSGAGNSGAGLGSAEFPLRTAANKFEAGGMYGFKEDGTFVGVRDTVYDTSRRAAACFEGGGCTTYDVLSLIGPGKFIRDMSNATPPRNYGFVRGPAEYTVSNSGFSMDHLLFYNDRGWGNGSEQSDPVGRLEDFGAVAVAGGKFIGVCGGSERTGRCERGGAPALVPRERDIRQQLQQASLL
jgi:hypothetical protein